MFNPYVVAGVAGFVTPRPASVWYRPSNPEACWFKFMIASVFVEVVFAPIGKPDSKPSWYCGIL
jgi:hypothetical protein